MTNIQRYQRFLCAAVLTAAMAACNGITPDPSPGLPATAPAGIAPDARVSWIRPAAAKGDLLYLSSPFNAALYIFTYPKLELAGVIGHIGSSIWYFCNDAKGDIFVPTLGQETVDEYPHGQIKPSASLKLPGLLPYSCAVDPTTGDLAVVSAVAPSGKAAEVSIFANAKGKPKTFDDPYVYITPWSGYDGHGNLFVDGDEDSSGAGLALTELPRGGKKIIDITLKPTLIGGGTLQWDGKDMTVYDGGTAAVERFRVNGSSGTVVGSTVLQDGEGSDGPYIFGGHAILPDQSDNELQIFPYPKGGSFTRSKYIYQVTWAAISVAPKQ